jgi:hypothetical protein
VSTPFFIKPRTRISAPRGAGAGKISSPAEKSFETTGKFAATLVITDLFSSRAIKLKKSSSLFSDNDFPPDS